MQADALATVLMVMAPDDAMALANRQHLRALLIGRQDAGYVATHSGCLGAEVECRRALATRRGPAPTGAAAC